MVWIEAPSNLHCPTCDARLHERAGKFQPMGRPDPEYIVDGGTPPVCPTGHELPDMEALFTYRDGQGHPPEAPYREVPTPPGQRP